MVRFGFRFPSLKKRLSSRTSLKRAVRHRLGLKAPVGRVIRLVLDSRAPSPFFPILRHLPCGAMMRLPIEEAARMLSNGSMAIGAGSCV
jgi:hypothetical protein